MGSPRIMVVAMDAGLRHAMAKALVDLHPVGQSPDEALAALQRGERFEAIVYHCEIAGDDTPEGSGVVDFLGRLQPDQAERVVVVTTRSPGALSSLMMSLARLPSLTITDLEHMVEAVTELVPPTSVIWPRSKGRE